MVDLRRNTRTTPVLPESIPVMRETRKPISRAKYDNLCSILKRVPGEYVQYFRSIPTTTDGGEDYPEESD